VATWRARERDDARLAGTARLERQSAVVPSGWLHLALSGWLQIASADGRCDYMPPAVHTLLAPHSNVALGGRAPHPPNGSHAKLCGRSRVPKPKRRGGCRREVACNDCRTATAVTPPRWRRRRQLGCRAEAGPHQLQREVGRRRRGAQVWLGAHTSYSVRGQTRARIQVPAVTAKCSPACCCHAHDATLWINTVDAAATLNFHVVLPPKYNRD
jgi:hypothetical protein